MVAPADKVINNHFCTCIGRIAAQRTLSVSYPLVAGLRVARKAPKLQLFGVAFKPLEGFKNGEIKTCLRLDTQDHVSEGLSWYKLF